LAITSKVLCMSALVGGRRGASCSFGSARVSVYLTGSSDGVVTIAA